MRHLRAFVAVAEERHFGRAAARLNLSQPPVSLAIKELEAELGLVLFERTSRRIELTIGGETLLRDARAILTRTDVLRENARKVSQGTVGSLSLGTTTLPTFSFLPEVLREFDRDYPGVRLTLIESTSDLIISGLQRGIYDVGCMFTMPIRAPGITYRPIGRDLLMVALPEDHPMARLERVPLERLADDKFLVFEREAGPLMFDSMVALCMRHGFSPKIFTARFMPTIVSLVSAGVGVALVPECLHVLQRKGVVYRPLEGDSFLVEYGAAWRTDDPSPMVRAFVDYLPAAPRTGATAVS